MNVIDCINNRRSVRSFLDQSIPQEVISQLITLGTKAATGSGNQPWGFVIITDKKVLKNLSDEIKKYLHENLTKFPYLHQYESWLSNASFNIFYDAPCLLIIYGNTTSHWYVNDCTLAAGNIMLGASEYDLGTCWIGFAHLFCNTAAFKSKYNVPDDYDLVCPMVIGYKKGQLAPPTRKPAPIFFCG